MLEVLADFVEELRAASIPISPTQVVDAARALSCLPLEDRSAVKYGLGAVLVSSEDHWEVFDTVFEVYFSAGRDISSLPGEEKQEESSSRSTRIRSALAQLRGTPPTSFSAYQEMTQKEIDDLLAMAVATGDGPLMTALVNIVVTRYAAIEKGRPVGGRYYFYRTLRYLDMDRIKLALSYASMNDDMDEHDPLTKLLREREVESRLDLLKDEIAKEIRRRLVADRGPKAVARSIRRPLPEEVDFMNASSTEMTALRRALYPLTRKLAAKLAAKRRHRHSGSLDFRSTIRHSLSDGGVPVDLKFRHPHPAKPELFVIADVSGSVASFARFTLQLLYALSAQFSRVRSFVFVDGIDEITEVLEKADDVAEAIVMVNKEADVVFMDGHSDYGNALSMFWERWGGEMNARTSVLILGDARSNYHPPRVHILKAVRARTKHVYWFNPEPCSYWDAGDSVLSSYAPFCDGVYECRNLRQLTKAIEAIGA